MSEFEEKATAEETPKEEDTSLSNSDVTTKYQEAAKIANATMLEVMAMCVPDAKVVDICIAGDAAIVEKASLIFRSKKGAKVEKGVAFPVCLSVNNCVCHYSPLASDESTVLALGDLVKLDLGAHVDGYIAVAAHTFRVTATGGQLAGVQEGEEAVTGPPADVMNAAYTAAEVAARLIKPGNTNKQVAAAVQSVAESFGVTAVAGTVMHQMKRFVIDASKVVLLRDDADKKVDTCTFEAGEVYAVDVCFTTGEGKPREENTRTTLYKRNVDKSYSLRVKSSRAFFSEVQKKYPTMPFTLRTVEDERQAKLGVRECVQHDLLTPYPVLFERPDSSLAHVKFTVLLLPSGTAKITGVDLPAGLYVSAEDKVVSEELQALLAEEGQAAKKKKRSKKKKTASASASAAPSEEQA
jgi:curved DNA binding protein